MPPKLIPLNRNNIDPLLHQHHEQLKAFLANASSPKDEVTAADFDADQAKEFRFRHYPIILLILKNPLKELISSVPPHPDKESLDSKQSGFLYLYDSRCPQYMDDGISWKKTRMSVKLIVYNKAKGIYKLKNHKNDEGLAVMRRQTWQGSGWRKNEYKLINRENYYKPESDGSFSVNECQTLQDFPVLVHYFKKNDSSPEHTPYRSESPTELKLSNSSLDLHKHTLRDSNGGLKQEDENPSKRRKMHSVMSGDIPPPPPSTSSSSNTTSNGTNGNNNKIPNGVNSTITTNGGSNNLISHILGQPPPPAEEQATAQFPLSNMHPMSPSYFFTPFPSEGDDKLIPMTRDDISFFATDFLQIPTIPSAQLVSNPPARTINVPTAQIPVALPDPTIEIKSFAPDSGPALDATRVLLVLDGLPKDREFTFTCMMEGVEMNCTQLGFGVVEFRTYPHPPGIVQFWLACREKGSKNVRYTNVMQFYFTPAGDSGRLSLAFHNLRSDPQTAETLNKFKHMTKELDLSNNLLTDVDFLSEFSQLHTLILDNNQISSASRFCHLPKLTALYIHSNCILELEPFIEKLRVSCPSLQYLSLLGNEACPVFSQAHHYYNYRIFVISKLRKLTQLDSSPVSHEEQRHASCLVEDELFNALDDKQRDLVLANTTTL